jgi:hypothetical protein
LYFNTAGVHKLLNHYDDFDSPIKVSPVKLDTKMVQKMFAVALDDLASMVTPEHIIFCEGSLEDKANESKKEFDAKVYNTIFPDNDALFIPADNKTIASKSGSLLVTILTNSGLTRKINSLVDKDAFTEAQIATFHVDKPHQKFLERKEIENYLLNKEIITKYCTANTVDITTVTSLLTDEVSESAKAVQGALMNQCGFVGNVDDFKLELAKHITPETNTYKELKRIIFE